MPPARPGMNAAGPGARLQHRIVKGDRGAVAGDRLRPHRTPRRPDVDPPPRRRRRDQFGPQCRNQCRAGASVSTRCLATGVGDKSEASFSIPSGVASGTSAMPAAPLQPQDPRPDRAGGHRCNQNHRPASPPHCAFRCCDSTPHLPAAILIAAILIAAILIAASRIAAVRNSGPARPLTQRHGYKSNVANTGAWSEGPVQPRVWRRMRLPWLAPRMSGVVQMWSNRRPLSARSHSADRYDHQL